MYVLEKKKPSLLKVLSMDYNFYVLKSFEKEAKALLKKYKSLSKDLLKLQTEIETNPLLGVNLGGGYKKLRLNISSKNKGKSGEARVITHEIIISIKEENDTKSVLFVSIYDKSDFESIDITLLENYVNEFRENEVNKPKEKKWIN